MILAIDIGGTHYRLALATREGQFHRHCKGRTDRQGGAEWMIARLIAEGGALLDQAPEPVEACGIGFGGPVDFAGQRILSSTHVPGWKDVCLPRILEQELGLKAVVENDANAGGLGEFCFGAGKGCRHLVYCTLSTGIGGGLILDGQVYRGGDGQAGELGHVPVLPDGPQCDCGNRGCLEALCSGKSIGQRAIAAVRCQPARGEMMRRLAGGGEIDARIVFDAARLGDPLAQEIAAQTCLYLGMGLATAVNLLAPDLIVVGGGVCKAGETLFAPLREQVRRFAMPVHRPHARIAPAQHPDHAVLLGAVALARELI